MLPLFLLCLAALASTEIAPTLYLSEHAKIHFESFIQKYNKQYVNEEKKQAKFEVFKDNLEKINSLNQKSEHKIKRVNMLNLVRVQKFVYFILSFFLFKSVYRQAFDRDLTRC